MDGEELILRLLKEEERRREAKIVETKHITAEDALIIGVLSLNRELTNTRTSLFSEMSRVQEELSKKIENLENRIGKRIDDLWHAMKVTWAMVAVLMAMQAATIAIMLRLLIP